MPYGTNQKFGGPGQDLGGLCPPGPSLKPPLRIGMKFGIDWRSQFSDTTSYFQVGGHDVWLPASLPGASTIPDP